MVALAGEPVIGKTRTAEELVSHTIPGKARALLTNPDSAPFMRAKRDEVAANGYQGFLLQ